MSERKNIDRLFQERFKDFEVKPPQETWANIEAKLDGKKKRRIIPFWWKLSGVAAVFLLGFLISKSINTGEVKTENSVVNDNNPNKTEQPNSKDINKNNGEIKAENPVVNGDNSNKTNTENENKKELKNNNSNSSSNGVANADDKVKNNIVSEEKNKKTKSVFSSKSAVAERKSNHRSLKNKSNSEGKTSETVLEKQENQVAQNQNNNSQSNAEKQIVQTDSKEKNNQITQDESNKTPVNLDDLKGNINSKIATKEIEKKVNDTVQKNSVANNVLEELLNEKESKLKQESKRNRWQLTSNVAPVFLGSVSNGSPIDSTLMKNPKSYNTNVGYGLGVSYVVNKKLTVRTGLNKVNISYDTNNIAFFTGIQAKVLANVTPTASSSMIHIQNSAVDNSSSLSESGLLPFENAFVHKNSGRLNQEIGYLEMPFEMSYSLFDKKFGLKIIGGFSTLFLQDNRITIVSDGRDTLLGRANNLNDVHFSTNLGLGIKYGFMKSFEFSLEPTLKYQLNTFSSNAGNFKPYIFGVYSGICYKF